MSTPYVRPFEHTSELLVDNPLGDPHVREVPVYLPPDYSSRRKDPYPVIFMLAGWGGRGAQYLRDGGAFSWPIHGRIDELIASREMPPAIVVFPDCTTCFGSSQYVNSPGTGPYMDYLCDELVDWVDRRFHTHRSRDYRGVVGHSSGGFGALAIGMLRPDRFGAICSSAGDCWYEFLYVHTVPATIRVIRSAGGEEQFINKFLASPDPLGLFGRDEVIAMMNLSICPCFAPNPQVPLLRGDVFFDLDTGELVPESWQRLLDWDPLRMVDRYVAQLRSLRWIHLEAGTEDEYGLCLGQRQLAKKLAKHRIEFTLDEYPGTHSGHHYRMPDRIRRMVERMVAD